MLNGNGSNRKRSPSNSAKSKAANRSYVKKSDDKKLVKKVKVEVKKPAKSKMTKPLNNELTSKQRAALRALANNIDPIYQVGKDGVSDMQIQGIAEALNKRELIKITVLKNSGLLAKDLIMELGARLDAIPVSSIGNKVILYKFSESDDVTHIEF